MKNENMKRDMRKALRPRFIYGDEIVIRRIALLYGDHDIKFIEDYRTCIWDGNNYKDEELGFAMLIRCRCDEWNDIVKQLGLKVDKRFRQKRVWKVA